MAIPFVSHSTPQDEVDIDRSLYASEQFVHNIAKAINELQDCIVTEHSNAVAELQKTVFTLRSSTGKSASGSGSQLSGFGETFQHTSSSLGTGLIIAATGSDMFTQLPRSADDLSDLPPSCSAHHLQLGSETPKTGGLSQECATEDSPKWATEGSSKSAKKQFKERGSIARLQHELSANSKFTMSQSQVSNGFAYKSSSDCTFSKLSIKLQNKFGPWPEWDDTKEIKKKRTNTTLEEDELEELREKRDLLYHHQFSESAPLASDIVVLHKSICTISPLCKKRMFWETIGTVVLLFDLGSITLQVFNPPTSPFTDFMTYVILWYWTFDIFASFLVGFFTNDGELVMSVGRIAKRYMMSWFAIDATLVFVDWMTVGFMMLGVSPPDVLDSLGLVRLSKMARATRIVRLVRLIRLRKIRDIFQILEDYIGSEVVAIVLSLLKNTTAILIINHVFACLWYWVGKEGLSRGEEQVWIHANDVEGRHWASRYLISLTWSLAQFTPGSSPIQPLNDFERIFYALVLLFALVAFSMFVSTVTNQVRTLLSIQASQKKKFWVLKKYLMQQQVTRDLSLRMTGYVKAALGSRQRNIQAQDVDLLGLLSTPLKEELSMQLVMRALLVHPLLKVITQKNLHIMRRLCRHAVVEVDLTQQDLLFFAGKTATAMYFLVHGLMRYRNWKLQEHEPGQVLLQRMWCSEAVLWTSWLHRGDMHADVDCQLVGLEAQQFRDIVCAHQGDRHYMMSYARAFISTLNDTFSEGQEVTDNHEYLLQEGVLGKVLRQRYTVFTGNMDSEVETLVKEKPFRKESIDVLQPSPEKFSTETSSMTEVSKPLGERQSQDSPVTSKPRSQSPRESCSRSNPPASFQYISSGSQEQSGGITSEELEMVANERETRRSVINKVNVVRQPIEVSL